MTILLTAVTRRNGIKSKWLSALPGSTQMLTVDSAGLVASQAIQTFAEIYAITTDPGIAGMPWNNAGHLVFSTGPYTPSLDFSDARNSQYVPLIFQDI